jgi:hypothetical protein
MMQTDVKSGQLYVAGQMVLGRTRLKGFVAAMASTGIITFWNSTTAPVVANYARTTTLITVSQIAHGLVVGQKVGLQFAVVSSTSATSGNYTVSTVPDANTFTVVDANSGSVAALTSVTYVASSTGASPWLFTYKAASTATNAFLSFPGEGIIADIGLYVDGTFSSVTIFYG